MLNEAVNFFWKALESETQEKVLCCTLEMFGLWTQKFRKELPSVILNIFKSGIQQKNITQIVKQSYIEWFLISIKHATITNHYTIVPDLISYTVEHSRILCN